MELSNCIMCGKMFRHDGMDVSHCPDCHEEHERLLRKVKDIILENPGLTAYEVSEMSGVSYTLILEWIKEGRLMR